MGSRSDHSVILSLVGCPGDVPCQLFPSPDWEGQELLAENKIRAQGTWHAYDQPILLVCHLLTGGPSFILAPQQPHSLVDWYLDRHAVCTRENKALVVLHPPGQHYLLVALQGSSGPGGEPAPIMLGFRCTLAAGDLMVATLQHKRLPLIFDLDETLLWAKSLSQLKEEVRQYDRRRAEGGAPSDSIGHKAAELEDNYRRQDLALLQQFAADEFVDWQGQRIMASYETGLGESGAHVQRPVLRLLDERGRTEIILVCIEPGNVASNMVFRIRPHWRAFYAYLLGQADGAGNRVQEHGPPGSKLRFEVFVCTAAKRDYALEAWRVLDEHGVMIPPSEVGRRLVSQAKRKSVDAVLRLRDDPKGPARFGMPLAIIVDDRIEVWEDGDQPQVLKVEPFYPHQEQAAGEVGARDQPTLQTLAEEMVRVQSQLANLRSHCWFTIHEGLKPRVQAMLQQPLDLRQPLSHYASLLLPPPWIAHMLRSGLHKTSELPALPPFKLPSAGLKPQDPRAAKRGARAQQGQAGPAVVPSVQHPPALPGPPAAQQQQGQQQSGERQNHVLPSEAPQDPRLLLHRQQQQQHLSQLPPPPQQPGPPQQLHQAQQAQQSAWGTNMQVRPAGPLLPGMLAPAPPQGPPPGPLAAQQQQQQLVNAQGHPFPSHQQQLLPQQQQQPLATQPVAPGAASTRPLHSGWFSLGPSGVLPGQAPGAPPQLSVPDQAVAGGAGGRGGAVMRPLTHGQPPLQPQQPPPQVPPLNLPQPGPQQMQQQFGGGGGGGGFPPQVGIRPPPPAGPYPQQAAAQQQQQQQPPWAGGQVKRKASDVAEGAGLPKVARQISDGDERLAAEDPVTFMSRAAQRQQVRLQYRFQEQPGGQWQATVVWDNQPVVAGIDSNKPLAKRAAAREGIRSLGLASVGPGAAAAAAGVPAGQPVPPQLNLPTRPPPQQLQFQQQPVAQTAMPGPAVQQQQGLVFAGGPVQPPRPPQLPPPAVGPGAGLQQPPQQQQPGPPYGGLRPAGVTVPPPRPPAGAPPPQHAQLAKQQQQLLPQQQQYPGDPKPGVVAGPRPTAAGRGGVVRPPAPVQHPQQPRQQHQPKVRAMYNSHNAINSLRDHFRNNDRVEYQTELPQDEEGVYKVLLVVNDNEYSEWGRANITDRDQQEAGGQPGDAAAPKDYSRAKRLVQRARQDAALKVLQKVGYTVDFAGTYTGGLGAPGQPPNAAGQAGGPGRGGGSGPGMAPQAGGRGAGPAGAAGGRGAGGDMKRFKRGPQGAAKSLDTRAALAAAAGPQAPPRDVYLKQLNEELS